MTLLDNIFSVGKNATFSKIICLLMTVAILLVPVQSKADSVKGYVKAGTTYLRVRQQAGGDILTDDSGNPIYLSGGMELSVLDQTNSTWYKVSFSYKDSTYSGYVSADYIVFSEEEATTESSTEEGSTEGTPSVSSDDSFEKSLSNQNFPESYKVLLREIHKKYPDWEFVAVHTGLDWSTVIESERNKSGQIKNLVNCTSSYPHYNWRATVVGYNYATDTWSSYDGSTWFAASKSLVEYYMDPRTYMYPEYMFAFESLSYQDGSQNKQGVEAILKGTFMYNQVPNGETQTYSEIIMEAAATYSISPYHLASRMKQEMGATGSTAAFGTNATYPGYYNYFNIGANDSASGNAVTAGVKWASTAGAYGRPWNTVKKAILGGAQYLAASYISKGQDTLYTQKFNVTNKSSLYSHQYMSNIQAPASEGNSVYRAYANNGLIGSSMVFKIPVYKNMPDSACVKPADSGSPNNWLKTLAVSGYTLTPSFAVNSTNDYSLIVPENVDSVSITASTVNSKATVSGTGKISLVKGTNTININVTAQNGNVRTYTLTVVRQGGNSSNQVVPSTESNTQVSTENSGTVTGKGDLNKDGRISTADVVKLRRLLVGLDPVTDEALSLGDINGDGRLSTADVVKIRRHLVGLELISN